MSQETIAAYFGSDFTQQNVSNFCEQIRLSLSKNFVKSALGAGSVCRENLCQRNSSFIKVFCNNFANDKAAIIADATYLPCEKSSNNEFQRYELNQYHF